MIDLERLQATTAQALAHLKYERARRAVAIVERTRRECLWWEYDAALYSAAQAQQSAARTSAIARRLAGITDEGAS